MKRQNNLIMELIYFKLTVFSLLPLFGFSQSFPVDGMKWFQQSKAYYEQDSLADALVSGYRALWSFEKAGNDRMATKAHMRVFQAQYKGMLYGAALQTAKSAIAISPDDTLRYRNHYNAGLCHLRLNEPDSALYYFLTAYDYFISIKDVERVAQNLNQIGLAYYYAGDAPKARKYYMDLLDFGEDRDLKKYKAFALNNIGNAYLKDGLKDSARYYLELALPYQDQRGVFTTYFNLARVSEDPYKYLLLAKGSILDRADHIDYLSVLHELRRYHTSSDSINYYANAIADLSYKMQEDFAATAELNLRYELQHINHEVQLARIHEEKKQERNRYVIL